jgi:imidazolonepropionase
VSECDLLLVHAGELFTPVVESEPRRIFHLRTAGAAGGPEQEMVTRITDGAIAVVGETIAEVGTTAELAARWNARETLDACGDLVTPAFADPHTHLIFAGERSAEFTARMGGRQAEAGLETGIASTARATSAASDDELRTLVRRRLDAWLLAGITLVEVKSGYALTVEGELRLLRLAREAGEGHDVEVVTTVLAAHALPAAYAGRAREYLDEVAWPVTEAARRDGLAEFADVFVEPDLFGVDVAEPYLRRAAEIGLGVRLHADQLTRSGGAGLAARLRAASADHLERMAAEDAVGLAAAGTVAVLAPGAVLTMEGRGDRRPPAQALVSAGVPIALATDFNPGSSTVASPALCLGLACRLFGMSPEAAWTGFTANAAASLGRGRTRGRLGAGYRADFCVWPAKRSVDLAYHLDAPRPREVVVAGRRAVRQSALAAAGSASPEVTPLF